MAKDETHCLMAQRCSTVAADEEEVSNILSGKGSGVEAVKESQKNLLCCFQSCKGDEKPRGVAEKNFCYRLSALEKLANTGGE